jgi:hypothetical protein
MTPRWLAEIDTDLSLQALPFLFAAAVLACIAMQARLLPVRVVPLAVPSTIGIPPGAAPQESIAPPAAVLSTPVLPSESLPTDPLVSLAEASLPATPSGRATDAWADHMPRRAALAAGAGNINVRAGQPTAISSLVANILRSLKRIHPIVPPRARTVTATLKAMQNPAKLRVAAMTSTPKPSLAGWGLGGPVPRRGMLGGPAPLAGRYAANLDGLTMGSRH